MTDAIKADETGQSGETAIPLTVHALTEFIFCPRAGILAWETFSNYEPREEWNALRFSPPYTLQELERSLQRNLTSLWVLSGIAAIALGGGGYGFVTDRNLLMIGAAVVLAFIASPIQRTVSTVQALVQLRSVVKNQSGHTPAVDAQDSQPVDWWEMLADGWMSIRNQEAYRDDQHQLLGTPWRVLRKGDFSVPVFKLVHADPNDPQVFPQHIVRLVAYCRLIEECERRQSPCGILLFGNSYRGVTIPNTPEARNAVDNALKEARGVLAGEADGENQTPVPSVELCRGCPWGRPQVYRQDVTELKFDGEIVPAYGKVAPNGKLYHSPCGDRFTWVPHHEDAMRLEIA